MESLAHCRCQSITEMLFNVQTGSNEQGKQNLYVVWGTGEMKGLICASRSSGVLALELQSSFAVLWSC